MLLGEDKSAIIYFAILAIVITVSVKFRFDGFSKSKRMGIQLYFRSSSHIISSIIFLSFEKLPRINTNFEVIVSITSLNLALFINT